MIASVIGTVGDWAMAEDAVQDAMQRALERWPSEGVPGNPPAWITTVARRRAIDLMRQQGAAARAAARLTAEVDLLGADEEPSDVSAFPHGDERLALIFTACHPALAPEARAALTLRVVLGVPVERLARLFGVSEHAMQKRLVRARAKIAHAGIPYRVPARSELRDRTAGVLDVLYGLFSIGYANDDADGMAPEAIRLARLCRSLMPCDSPERLELDGLLALMLLQHSRSEARIADGAPVPFARQDRRLWDADSVAEGLSILDAALDRAARDDIAGGRHFVHAMIAAEYARPAGAVSIDHARIVGLYRVLERLDPSPFVRLNRAIAEANAGDPAAALATLDSVAPLLAHHHLLHAARGDVLARLGRRAESAQCFRRAAAEASTERERRAHLVALDDAER